MTDTGITVFANAASRDAVVLHPTIGQAVFLIDSGSVLYYFGPSLGWRPPWGIAWGVVARTVDTTVGAMATPAGSGEYLVPTMATQLVAIPGRKYRISVNVMVNQGTTAANGYVLLRVYDGAPSNGIRLGQPSYPFTVPASGLFVLAEFDLETTLAPAPGGGLTHTLNVTFASPDPSGNGGNLGGLASGIDQFVQYVTVNDVGPAANPIYR